jgi:ferric-dicitrate binding protein FerR (iron transport regulator)
MLLLISLSVTSAYWFSAKEKDPGPVAESRAVQTDIEPGSTKAILRGAHGAVALSGKDTSFVLGGNRVQINDSGLHIAKGKAVQYTLTVPRGGSYRVVLPDGTQAWLNADSRLEYPSVFTKDVREVSLTGEAYFEVKTDAAHPFIVKLPSSATGEGQGEVRVLGTAFNIQAYPEDHKVITTLIDGKLQVNSKDKQLILSPGEQALLNRGGQLALNPHANVEQVIAWKNGYFRFDKADIYTIMEQLARWYNIEVSYAGNLPLRHFGAIISRNNNISGILNMLEATGEVHFHLEGKQITVMP